MPQTQQDKLLAHLAANGPIEDPTGHLTHQLADAIGCGTGVMTTLLWKLDRDGRIVRTRLDPANPRSTVIGVALADGVTVPTIEQPPMFDLPDDPAPVDPDDHLVDEPADAGVDINMLAMSVLDQALACRAAQRRAEEEALTALLNAEEAIERQQRLTAEVQKLTEENDALCAEVNDLRGETHTLNAEMAAAEVRITELKAALDMSQAEAKAERQRADQAEAAAACFRDRCDELDATNGKLKKALAASEEEVARAKRNGNGYPIRSLSPESADHLADLARMMQKRPTAKG